jgi:DNA-binding response OmpR family regulator
MLSRHPRVLVVDDEPTIRESLERALRLEGFALETAVGGRAALVAVSLRLPAIIVLDVTMPDLDGVRVLRRLRADGIDVPVCILSARDDTEDRPSRACRTQTSGA